MSIFQAQSLTIPLYNYLKMHEKISNKKLEGISFKNIITLCGQLLRMKKVLSINSVDEIILFINVLSLKDKFST